MKKQLVTGLAVFGILGLLHAGNVLAADYPLTLTDSSGKEICLEKEPEKVVSVAPNMTELIFALDAQDKLIGRSDYCDYPAEAAEIESVGSLQTPDLEKIISIEPDLVVVSTHFDEEVMKKLTEVGIPVLELNDSTNMDGVYNMISTLGQALNKEEKAGEIVTDMKTVIDDVTEKVASLEKPSAYYVIGYGEGGDYTAGGDTFIGQMINIAGGSNIAQDISGWMYSFEMLLDTDPQIIIIPAWAEGDFGTSGNYGLLSAVKENHVYPIDNNLLDRQGYRNAQGILELAKIFHPEVFE